MSASKGLITVVALIALAAVSAAIALALPSAHGSTSTTAVGYPGMMGGYSGTSGRYGGMMGDYGMMGGYGSPNAAAPTSAGSLPTVRSRVEHWLDSRGFQDFHVSEVMAFTNNDYVAVQDAHGKPAFELLTTPTLSWLMEEPPSMMWNSRYGMMRGYGRSWSSWARWCNGMIGGGSNGWYGEGMMGNGSNGRYGGGNSTTTSVTQAARIANRWLAQVRPGETAEADGRAFPGYFTLDTTRNGKTAGMLSVNATTGAVWYHRWHGRFLREQQF